VREALLGQVLTDVSRHGRMLILHFGAGRLLVNAGLGSRFGSDVRSPRFEIGFEGGERLAYQSVRKGPAITLTDEAHLASHPWMVESGQEPLSPRFTVGSIKRILDKRKRRVKFALADERLVAGVGSTYADEALFLAGVRPTRYVSSLSDDEIRRVYWSLLQILQKAIRFGGTAGSFGRFLNVVGREGQPCAACREARVNMIYLGGEKTYWCPDCQR
ncbi:MAG: Fpg/Nei family DNA glycosylase, partial [Candidatus Xenobia bacterium]